MPLSLSARPVSSDDNFPVYVKFSAIVKNISFCLLYYYGECPSVVHSHAFSNPSVVAPPPQFLIFLPYIKALKAALCVILSHKNYVFNFFKAPNQRILAFNGDFDRISVSISGKMSVVTSLKGFVGNLVVQI